MATILGERGLDALRELFNIGAGAAATSLSEMLGGEKVTVEVPSVTCVPTRDVGDALGAQQIFCAVGFAIYGGLEARLLVILDEYSARRLAAALLGRPVPDEAESSGLDSAARSALDETGNILASSFVSGLGKMTGTKIMPSVPASGFDVAGTAVGSVLARFGESSEDSIVCRTDFTTRGTRIHGHLLLLPEHRSISEILNALGIDPAT